MTATTACSWVRQGRIKVLICLCHDENSSTTAHHLVPPYRGNRAKVYKSIVREGGNLLYYIQKHFSSLPQRKGGKKLYAQRCLRMKSTSTKHVLSGPRATVGNCRFAATRSEDGQHWKALFISAVRRESILKGRTSTAVPAHHTTSPHER